MEFVVVALALWALASVALFFGRRMQAKRDLLAQVPTSPAAEVPRLIPGELVEVKGTIRCATPLTAELSGREVVYYSSKVTREYEERERKSDGETRTVRRSEVVAENKQFTPFYVEDDSGQVLVDPDGAEFDVQQLVNRFEQRRDRNALATISFGGLTLDLGRQDGTIGFRYSEHALPVGTPVYVLGAVQESGTIGRMPAGTKRGRFIISYRSEEVLKREWGKQARMLGYAALGLGVLGIISFLVGLVSMVL